VGHIIALAGIRPGRHSSQTYSRHSARSAYSDRTVVAT